MIESTSQSIFPSNTFFIVFNNTYINDVRFKEISIMQKANYCCIVLYVYKLLLILTKIVINVTKYLVVLTKMLVKYIEYNYIF